MKRVKKASAVRGIFFLYCLLMFWLLLGQRMDSLDFLRDPGQARYNLIPLKTIRWYLELPKITANTYLLRHGYINLVGNIVMFIPLGILLPGVCKIMKRFWAFFLSAAAGIAAMEILQLLSGLGICDVDDLILNLLGALSGYLFYRIFAK